MHPLSLPSLSSPVIGGHWRGAWECMWEECQEKRREEGEKGEGRGKRGEGSIGGGRERRRNGSGSVEGGREVGRVSIWKRGEERGRSVEEQ